MIRIRANVASTWERWSRAYRVRNTETSKTIPSSAVAGIASSTPATNEPVSCTKVEARNAPSMYSDPCARLIMSMMPKTSVSPAASRNSISPNCRPFSDCSRTRIAGIRNRGQSPISNWALTPISGLLHAAVFEPEVLVLLEDGADLAVDDAPVLVLDEFAHVVVLDRRAIRRFLEVPARAVRALRRLHQRRMERFLVLDLALRVAHRLVDDERRGVALLGKERRQPLVLLLELGDELAVRVVIEVVGP